VPVFAKATLMKTFIKDARWGQFILITGDLISRYMSEFGEWCETEIDLFRFILPNNGVCIEVGANMGTHTVPLSKICANGRIFCFEPQRPIFQILCGNLALNNCTNVFAVQQAVGAASRLIEIQTCNYDRQWNYGSFSISEGFSTEEDYEGPLQREAVEMVALDDHKTISGLEAVDLLKIDVEGHEMDVLSGSERLVSRTIPDIFIEAHNKNVVQELMGFLKRFNYKAYWFVAKRIRDDNFCGSNFRFNFMPVDVSIILRSPARPSLPLPLFNDFSEVEQSLLPILERFP
jgi:FkbM family methyltransferase